MKMHPSNWVSKIDGVELMEPVRYKDSRGSFNKFSLFDIDSNTETYLCVSHNVSRGTVRGMHCQKTPWEENKFVMCMSGSSFHALVDLRIASTTFGKWTSLEINSKSRYLVQIGKGIAHGFQSLEDSTEILYIIQGVYKPELNLNFTPTDSNLGIRWPLLITNISDRDLRAPSFREALTN